MDNNTTKLDSGDSKNNDNSEQQEHEENPNLSSNGEQQPQEGGEGEREGGGPQSQTSRRTPFTNLSQVDADLALARTLQEQERAYMMLRMNNDGSDYGSWEGGSYLHDDEDDFGDPDDETDGDDDGEEEYNDTDVDDDADAFDVHAHADAGEDDNTEVEIDPSVYSSDESYARALQEAEERDMAARLLALAGLNDREVEEDSEEDRGGNSQETWEEVDPDELSYEELLALGEVVGTESRGLSADTIASLPSINYRAGSSQNGNNDS
ncbi:unnamed protein product [Dovyalis caffra]|uniref:E3 ubiquitin ligase BIG BROTHER-related n=1 Tax=Dovyalis caffra TaxID=77055 RepID=A0AAV1RQQ4_9ROSI|nr:unnamed protein product [Dovyalis caffra]